jgi:hypothetical protein
MALKCPSCGEEQALPKHCGRDMLKRDGKLVCWMNLPKEEGGLGRNCGMQEIPGCKTCDHVMDVV